MNDSDDIQAYGTLACVLLAVLWLASWAMGVMR